MLHLSHLSLAPRERLALLEKHTSRNPTNATLQLLRLQALTEVNPTLTDKAYDTAEEIAKAVCKSPSDLSAEEAEAVQEIWARWFDACGSERRQHDILLLSLRQSCSSIIHPVLLSRLYTSRQSSSSSSSSSSPIPLLNTIREKYRPSPPFYAAIIDSFSPTDPAAGVVYEHWTRTCKTAEEKVQAALAYAALLMRARKGKEAAGVVGRVKGEVKGDAGLEVGWEAICRAAEAEGDAEDSEEEMLQASGEESDEEEEDKGEEGDMIVDM